MKLWGSLYALIWVVLLEFILGMTPLWKPVITYLHIALGLLLIGITYSNYAGLRETTVPGRIKRVSQATFGLSILMAPLGILLFFNVGSGWPLLLGATVLSFFNLLHVVNAVAIVTQASAVAIAYDMWEEKEFAAETRPGEIPPAPTPVRAVATTK